MPSAGPFTLTSEAFADGEPIPREYTCQGADVSPALAWTGQPPETGQLLLVVDDPDAGGFVHWIIVIGSGQDFALPKAYPADSRTAQQGVNGFGRIGYGGPCPPSGTHHYRFTLSALGESLQLSGHPTIDQVRAALATVPVLGPAVLTGTYRKG
jgi:Raf kinase inhibitor-like YbhB/YbcL family protein